MASLKLDKLPNRKPVKFTFEARADLAAALDQYADAYHQAYGQAEPVSELIPFMLDAFLASDRGFTKAREQKPSAAASPASPSPADGAAPQPLKPET